MTIEIQTGKPIEVESGKIYVLQTDQNISHEHAKVISDVFQKGTGSKAVILSNGMKIAVESEIDIREKIAQEIAQEIEKAHLNCWSFTDCTHIKDAAIARGQVK